MLERNRRTAATTGSVLSYFRSYFDPDGDAPRRNHSTGQIAAHLHDLLAQRGAVTYLGSKDRPSGLRARVFIGHFWGFLDVATANDFDVSIAFYPVSDPALTRQLMVKLAARFDVPVPDWDLPPNDFDHEATMEAADLVFVVGNDYTLSTFPERWHAKIRMLSYSVDRSLYERPHGVTRNRDLCYVATHCGLRKGFPDVVNTWAGIRPDRGRLHVVGHLDPLFDTMLAQANTGSVTVHGWIDSDSDAYVRLLQSCRFAYIPTYSEGQMGTLLEAIHAGCVPITTAASGLDDSVLAHCVVVEPLDHEGQRAAILEALAWSDAEYQTRRAAISDATCQHQTWERFSTGVQAGLAEMVPP